MHLVYSWVYESGAPCSVEGAAGFEVWTMPARNILRCILLSFFMPSVVSDYYWHQVLWIFDRCEVWFCALVYQLSFKCRFCVSLYLSFGWLLLLLRVDSWEDRICLGRQLLSSPATWLPHRKFVCISSSNIGGIPAFSRILVLFW